MLISIDDAFALIVDQTAAVEVEETEQVELDCALGRILAGPVRSSCMTPPFDNAAMDGYAVATSSALNGNGPWALASTGGFDCFCQESTLRRSVRGVTHCK